MLRQVGRKPRLRALLDLDGYSEPISGRLWPPGDHPPLLFKGWIQLTAAIEALRTGGSDDRNAAAGAHSTEDTR